MGDYQALLAYFGVAFVVFVGGILWRLRRETIKRIFRIREYRSTRNDSTPAAHVEH